MDNPEPAFYTVRELADLLRIDPMTVRRLEWSGKLRGLRVGRSLRFTREDVAAFVESCREGEAAH